MEIKAGKPMQGRRRKGETIGELWKEREWWKEKENIGKSSLNNQAPTLLHMAVDTVRCSFDLVRDHRTHAIEIPHCAPSPEPYTPDMSSSNPSRSTQKAAPLDVRKDLLIFRIPNAPGMS